MNGGTNSGFVNSFGNSYPQASADALQQIMNFFPLGNLRSLHTLAQNFLVCDRWFSSLPGPTWLNRLFVHSGTSKGHVDMSLLPAVIHAYDQTTVYDLLSAANINWRIYYGDIAQSLLLTHQLQHPGHYHRFDDDFLHDASGSADQFPAYTFIEPHYFGPSESDQHPVHGVQNGDALIGKVYNAIRANIEL
jgi:phospholipase C